MPRAKSDRPRKLSDNKLIAFVILGWFFVSWLGIVIGEWWGFLIFGAGWFLCLFPRLYPSQFFRTGSALRNRVYELAAVAGVLLISFGIWRFIAENAFDRRIEAYADANDAAALVREVKQVSWTLERCRAVDALVKAIAHRARNQSANCIAHGDQAVQRSAECLVWDTERDLPHAAQALLGDWMQYQNGGGPLTVFLVSGKRIQQVGTYSISHEPAFLECVDVCVVQFDDLGSAGKPLACHEVVSLDPRETRPVQQNPEYGDPAPPLARWIASLHRKGGKG
jgi:hypothetical protein